jgi:hypothetical protein
VAALAINKIKEKSRTGNNRQLALKVAEALIFGDWVVYTGVGVAPTVEFRVDILFRNGRIAQGVTARYEDWTQRGWATDIVGYRPAAHS